LIASFANYNDFRDSIGFHNTCDNKYRLIEIKQEK